MKFDETSAVVRCEPCGPGYVRLLLDSPRISAEARPGQFVHIKIPCFGEERLRRPFSIFGADGGRLEILFKVVGAGTRELAKVRAGDKVDAIGPLGRGFPDPQPGAVPLLVGGGYGVAPLRFLARRLAETGAGPRPVLFAGGRTAADLLALDEFERLGVECCTATNDGSAGARGLVTAPLDDALKELRAAGKSFELFACGPEGMLKAVADRALAMRAPGWISLDKRMACGVGACFACAVKTRDSNGGIAVVRCCLNGPVFKAAEIVWD